MGLIDSVGSAVGRCSLGRGIVKAEIYYLPLVLHVVSVRNVDEVIEHSLYSSPSSWGGSGGGDARAKRVGDAISRDSTSTRERVDLHNRELADAQTPNY